MTSLSALLAALTAAIQAHPLCNRVTQIETKTFSADQFLFRIRAELSGQLGFQARVYYNRGHTDYAYQLYATVPLLRWDNKEEFRSVVTYPHHHHDENGGIHPSPLTGDPVADIEAVLDAVAHFLSTHQDK
ncbi:MAG: hypothetical protein FJZ90_11000 [Chloroflexi bacterium]|nr:hypothetical protein [Chloroflexota bacterium]